MVLILNRTDIRKPERDSASIDNIKYYHIKGGLEMFKRASMVIFIDDDGKTKVLKNRESKKINHE